MKEFLTYLLSLIVDHPEEVIVEENQISPSSFQYLLKANQEDIGKIIGKQGKIIQAIRNIAKVLAVKKNIQIRIEIV